MIIYYYTGLVAQWTRARGYEPRCQGFESLLAQILGLSINNINNYKFIYPLTPL